MHFASVVARKGDKQQGRYNHSVLNNVFELCKAACESNGPKKVIVTSGGMEG